MHYEETGLVDVQFVLWGMRDYVTGLTDTDRTVRLVNGSSVSSLDPGSRHPRLVFHFADRLVCLGFWFPGRPGFSGKNLEIPVDALQVLILILTRNAQ